MVIPEKKNKGFIAILSLLIIATISMIIAMTLLKDGVDNATLSLSNIHYENAKLNAGVCLEDTLVRLKREERFTRNLNYTLETGQNCGTIVQWHASQPAGGGRWETLVNLEVSGTSGHFSRTFSYALRVKRTTVNHTDGSVKYTNNIDIISITELTG